MKVNSDFKELLHSLNNNQVKYLIVGGYAYIEHVEPRYTKDLDVWVKADAENARNVYRALMDFGAPLARYTAEDFSQEGFFFVIGTEPSRVDILMSVTGLDFDSAWARRVESDYGGEKVLFISKEDLITVKLAAGRPQDLVDVQRLKDTQHWESLAQTNQLTVASARIQVELPSGKVVNLEIEGKLTENVLHEIDLSAELVAELEELQPGQTYKVAIKEIEAQQELAPSLDPKLCR